MNENLRGPNIGCYGNTALHIPFATGEDIPSDIPSWWMLTSRCSQQVTANWLWQNNNNNKQQQQQQRNFFAQIFDKLSYLLTLEFSSLMLAHWFMGLSDGQMVLTGNRLKHLCSGPSTLGHILETSRPLRELILLIGFLMDIKAWKGTELHHWPWSQSNFTIKVCKLLAQDYWWALKNRLS